MKKPDKTDMSEIAHINPEFQIQSLSDHLAGTAEMSSRFASLFNSTEWGKLLGLWHDLGKYSNDFQEYIRINSGYEENDQKLPKTDHTSAGAILAKELYPGFWPPIAYCIAGHHAGLHNWLPEPGISGDLSGRLMKQEFLNKIRSKIPDELLGKIELMPPGLRDPKYMNLWIRMLFSCLVDADYLDTERFMNPESFEKRGKYDSIEVLNALFESYINQKLKDAPATKVNLIRKKILNDCIESSQLDPGFFSVTVPTGGGKTLSSMAWALKHALRFNKKRIVFAIPYTSIISQTAQIYRHIFGEDNVIEHHSNLDENADSPERKLAAENWDAPVIVTTNVQLFESLFANKTSRCRKLHNLVDSIIILDEAQMLPPEYLSPILSVLNGMAENFGASVMFSTATQPALTGKIGGKGQNAFDGIPTEVVREVVKGTDQLTTDLKRVSIEMPVDLNQSDDWETIATQLEQFSQVLCVVNTRKQCRELYNQMPTGTIHLSRLMCTAHIMDTIEDIKLKLENGEHARVVSTQLIEAGVDIDFPAVYRAIGGLDSIAQCAGRCNREGKLNKENQLGKVKVFIPPTGSPKGLMRKGADTTKEFIAKYQNSGRTYLEPESFNEYFKLFYSKINDFDTAGISDSLWKDARYMKFQFATAAREFKLIDDKGAKIILVEYKKGSDLIQQFKRKGPESWLMRKLQSYSVSVNDRDFNVIRQAGMIEEIHGCWVQAYSGLYDKHSGLMINGEWLEEINII